MNRLTDTITVRRASPRSPSSASRAGATIVEALAASTVIATVFALLVPAVAGFHRASRQIDARMLATQEVQNLLEETLAAWKRNMFDMATFANSLEDRELSDDAKAILREARFVSQATRLASPQGERLSVTLTYRTPSQPKSASAPTQSVTLHAWLWEANR